MIDACVRCRRMARQMPIYGWDPTPTPPTPAARIKSHVGSWKHEALKGLGLGSPGHTRSSRRGGGVGVWIWLGLEPLVRRLAVECTCPRCWQDPPQSRRPLAQCPCGPSPKPDITLTPILTVSLTLTLTLIIAPAHCYVWGAAWGRRSPVY